MKRLIWVIPLILIIGIIVLFSYLKFVLPDVGPAPEITIEYSKAKIERGEYLANAVMACVDCHSMRDFTKYAGPVTGVPFAGGGEEFTKENGAPGDFYAPNLTPYHLKDWTDGEIYRAITAGVSKDGRALFPGMPYHLYGQASKEDIYSVIAYLRTLPAYENAVPESDPEFPFSLIMNTIPKKPEHKNIPKKDNIVAYGKYMTTIAGCIDCHTPFKKGQLLLDSAYAGGREFIMPGGIIRTTNITPDKKTGIGNWTEEMFVNRFKIYKDSSYIPQDVGDGFNTIMPWGVYANIKEDDLKAIFAYLQSLEPIKNEISRFTPNE